MKKSLLGTWLTIFFSVLFFASCSKHQLTDAQYIEQAKVHKSQHQLRAAIIQLKNALQVNPKSVAARQMLGEIYVDLGDGKGGEKELRRAEELGASDNKLKVYLAKALILQNKNKEVIDRFSEEQRGDILISVVDAYLALGEMALAKSYLEKANRTQPESMDVKLSFVKLALSQGDYDVADKHLQEIFKASPDNIQAWRYKGVLDMQQAKFGSAENAFKKVIDLDQTGDISVYALQAKLGLIQSLLAQKKLDEAENEVQQLKEKNTQHPTVDYVTALIAFEKGDFETARSELQKLNSKLPDYLPGILLLGASHYALGSYEQADVYLSRYVNEVPSHLHARKLLAATRVKQKRSSEALELLKGVEESSPEDTQLISMIARIAITSGDVLKGTEYLKRATSVNPNDPSIRAELARVLMSQGAFDEAIKELEAITDKHGKSRDILLVFANLRKKDFAEARKIAKKLAEQKPGPDMETLIGGVELMSGARSAARTRFEKALKLQKDFIPALLNLARMDLEDGSYSSASKHFDAVLQKQPANIKALFGLALLADKQGDKQQALTYIEKAREANKEAILPSVVLGRYYLKTGETGKAMALVDEFKEAQLKEPAVMLLAGKIYRSGGKHEKSVDIFKNLVQALPDEPGAHFELANSQVRLGNIEDAIISLKKALSLKDDFQQARYALAKLEMQKGSVANALSLASKIQEQDNSSALGYSLAGDIHMREKAYDKAIVQYKEAYKREKSSVLALKSASAYSGKKMYDKAIEVLQERLRNSPDDFGIQMALAQQYQNKNNLAKATQIMEQVLIKQPENAVVLNNLAWMYHEKNDTRALDYAERAHKLRPDAAAITDTLGWLLVQNDQQLPRALELLQVAANKMPDLIDIKYHLSVALYKNGKNQEAKGLLSEIVASKKEFSDLKNAQELLDKLK